jgi:anthranilate phosphoribosyltransferase
VSEVAKVSGTDIAESHVSEAHGEEHEQVVSPDQLKPTNRKLAHAGAFITAAILLLMLIGNQRGHVEDFFLVGTAALLIGAVVADWLLRKNGLRA